MNEELYKLALVRHYSSQDPLCIAIEMPFLAAQRRADAVVVKDDGVHGIEIKSDRDNLDSLTQQIADYIRVFDFVWLLLSKSHLDNSRNILPPSVGLIVLEDGNLVVKRKAKQVKRLDKKALSLSLDRFGLVYLLSTLNINQSRAEGVDELSKKLTHNATIQALKNEFKSQILRKYQKSYKTFKREAGVSIHLEDLLNLGIHRELR